MNENAPLQMYIGEFHYT